MLIGVPYVCVVASDTWENSLPSFECFYDPKSFIKVKKKGSVKINVLL